VDVDRDAQLGLDSVSAVERLLFTFEQARDDVYRFPA
jgi:hypothetical protein